MSAGPQGQHNPVAGSACASSEHQQHPLQHAAHQAADAAVGFGEAAAAAAAPDAAGSAPDAASPGSPSQQAAGCVQQQAQRSAATSAVHVSHSPAAATEQASSASAFAMWQDFPPGNRPQQPPAPETSAQADA